MFSPIAKGFRLVAKTETAKEGFLDFFAGVYYSGVVLTDETPSKDG